MRKQKYYEEPSSIWSEIKPVFMALAHNKCAFCEKGLEGEPFGYIEHDMEHFRPKSAIQPWPSAEVVQRRNLRYRFSTGGGTARGYYLLAYSLLNYVTACKTCNTAIKGTYFPISGRRSRRLSHEVAAYASERPLLIYPLGDVDVPPETLLTFRGITPIPVVKSGVRKRRAVVTIDFFELDTRPDLLRARAEKVTALYLASQSRDPAAVKVRDYHISPQSAHSNCGRAFDALCRRDSSLARHMYEEAADYLYPSGDQARRLGE